MKLRIMSVTGMLLETETDAIRVPALDGSLGIHPGHIPMIAALGGGSIYYLGAGGEEQFEIPNGILEVRENVVTVLTDGG